MRLRECPFLSHFLVNKTRLDNPRNLFRHNTRHTLKVPVQCQAPRPMEADAAHTFEGEGGTDSARCAAASRQIIRTLVRFIEVLRWGPGLLRQEETFTK